MIKRLSIATFSILSLVSLGANAANDDESTTEDSSGWTDAPAEPETKAEPAEAAPEAAKSEAKPAAQTVTIKVSATTEADAQQDKAPEADAKSRTAHRHDGFYMRFSLGGGSLRAQGQRTHETGTTDDYQFAGNALSGDLMIGGTPGRGLVIGGAYIFSHAKRSDGYSSPNADDSMSLGLLGPFIDFYPNPTGGFHVGAALGVAGTITYDQNQEQNVSAYGGGGSAWVGYDMWIGKQWSLGGILRATGARVETPQHMQDAPTTDRDKLGAGSIALLASITYH